MAPRLGRVFKPLADRIEEKYIPEPNSGCWLWTGATNGHGYGKISIGHSGRAYAHRVSYELAKGPIPQGLVLDHLCRVPSCVNPDHLEPVTNQENCRRGECGIANSSRTHCIRGHAFAEHGYLEKAGTRQCKLCLKIRIKKWKEKKNGIHR